MKVIASPYNLLISTNLAVVKKYCLFNGWKSITLYKIDNYQSITLFNEALLTYTVMEDLSELESRNGITK